MGKSKVGVLGCRVRSWEPIGVEGWKLNGGELNGVL